MSAKQSYQHETMVLETIFETGDGAVRLIDFMPPRGKYRDVVRIVEGIRGTVEMELKLIIRFDYGLTVPWVKRSSEGPDRGGRAERAGAAFRRSHFRPGPDHARAFFRRARRSQIVRADLAPLARAAAGAGACLAVAGRDAKLLARMGRALHLSRRVARRCAALAHHAEGADLRAHRRHRRGADDLAAGKNRRRAQLGLPLLLAARCDIHALFADAGWLHRGGGGVEQLAAARGGGRPGAIADHVRRGRRAAAGGN